MSRTADRDTSADTFLHRSVSGFGKPICRLGLAARGGCALTVEDVHFAVEQGINVLSWPGTEDALSRAVAGMGARRDEVVIVAQFEARTAADAAQELRALLTMLRTDYLDVLTF